MNVWKVILVTVVIFGTGVVTGTVLGKRTAPVTPPQEKETSVSRRGDQPPRPDRNRQRSFLSRIEKELDLTPDQAARIEEILNDGQERTKALWDEIAPRMKEEFNASQERIREVLTPEQQDEFEKLFKKNRRSKHEKSNDDSACRLGVDSMALPIDGLLDRPCPARCDAPEAEPST